MAQAIEIEKENDRLKDRLENEKEEAKQYKEIFEHLCNTNDGLRE